MFTTYFGTQDFGYFDVDALDWYGEELRYTWAARYTGDVFTPPNGPHIGGPSFAKFTQTATVLLGSTDRSVVAAQTMAAFPQSGAFYTFAPLEIAVNQTMAAFTQVATVTSERLAVASQTMAAFAQVATIGMTRLAVADQQIPATTQVATALNNPRNIAATQLIPAFVQTAFAGDGRDLTTPLGYDNLGMIVAPVAQVATITTVRAATAAQTFVIGQVATVQHASVGAAAGQTVSAFGQVATAKALLALTANQIILPIAQGATIAGTRSLSASTLLAPFQQYGLIEGAYVSSSLRGYLVRPEIRTFRPPLT
jgi:hypothetical protein